MSRAESATNVYKRVKRNLIKSIDQVQSAAASVLIADVNPHSPLPIGIFA
jgi:hypothetical protein